MYYNKNNKCDIENQKLKSENELLRQQKIALEGEVNILRKKVAFFENHSSISQGIRGETLVALLIDGCISKDGSSYDVSSGKGLIRIEVKYSKLNVAVQLRPTKRWNWAKPFGESGDKEYDRLILIGEKDRRYFDAYLDKETPYIIFDVPYEEVPELATKSSRHGFPKAHITLTSNPETARSKASPLFYKYQITGAKLKERYRFL
jgi:hypothetical protein